MSSRQRNYIVSGRKRVKGWFFRVDAEIFHLLTSCQNHRRLGGAVAEVGLHHGKSFIALCLALQPGEKAYGVDLFEEQHLNRDRSGRGARATVEGNLAREGVLPGSFVLDARSSDRVSAEDVLGQVGPVRFFSIDGGHWTAVVKNDLRLAELTLAEHGIVALDDFLRPEWPEVSAGYFEWVRERSRAIIPFAIGFNKLYLCEQQYHALYRETLNSSPFLAPYFSKHYQFCGNEISVYQQFPLPEEWNLRTRIVEYMKLFHPDFYSTVRKLRPSLRGLTHRRA